MFSLSRVARRLGNRFGHRWTHSEQVIPLKPGAIPQYVIKCHGTHRQGLVEDVSTIIASRGAI